MSKKDNEEDNIIEKRNNIIKALRDENPDASEEEINKLADIFILIESKSFYGSKIYRFKRWFIKLMFYFIINLLVFGLLSYYINFNGWYVPLIYCFSLAFVELCIKKYISMIKAINRVIFLNTGIEIAFIILIMIFFNKNYDYLTFDNNFMIFCFIMVSRLLRFYVEYKYAMSKIERK